MCCSRVKDFYHNADKDGSKVSDLDQLCRCTMIQSLVLTFPACTRAPVETQVQRMDNRDH